MVLFARDHIMRRLDVAQADAAFLEREAIKRQVIVPVKIRQIFARHPFRQSGGILIPEQQIEFRRGLPKKIGFDRRSIDQVVRTQIAERPRHDALIEITLPARFKKNPADKALINEHFERTRVLKVGEGCEEGRRLDRGGGGVPADPGKGDGQRRASDAVADDIAAFST